ncbi:MAG: hypothetical protein IKO36_02045, partial [Bacteroidaceae bacterium]|nr:hypothetical protein [Bacteroidaceae bacterium]
MALISALTATSFSLPISANFDSSSMVVGSCVLLVVISFIALPPFVISLIGCGGETAKACRFRVYSTISATCYYIIFLRTTPACPGTPHTLSPAV